MTNQTATFSDRRRADGVLNTALEAAGDSADKVQKTKPPVVEMKDCGRCGGKGYAHFLGNDRAPGVCFKCGGAGRIPATRAGAKLLQQHADKRELARLRVLWRGYADADAVKAAETAGQCSAHLLDYARRQLASIEIMGREAAKRLA